jgi:pimeloyl-ACP methyl ester carboxylesterase
VFQTLALVASLGAPHSPAAKHRPPLSVATYQGSFADGATYLIQVPQPWNGGLVLYSHGYVLPGAANGAADASDPVTGAYLLSEGYALAGSSYATTGWAIQQALPDQIEVLSSFPTLTGRQPSRTIAWGDSMGGLVTTALIQQYPTQFNAALPMCGVVSGGVGFWNQFLDSGYAFNTLVAGNQLQVVNIGDALTNYDAALTDLGNAQAGVEGQARIALVAALADEPGWYLTGYPPPAKTDYTDQEIYQYYWMANAEFLFEFFLRAELEGRAGGNPSWNDGIDYKAQLEASVDSKEVKQLYKRAGLDLNFDLSRLNAGATISADQGALDYLTQNIILDGQISVPVLTLHTTGDGVVVNANENAYASGVAGAGNSASLQQVFVNRAGHCAFTSGEEIAAFEALIGRLNTGSWSGLGASALNKVANKLGSGYNPLPPAYVAFKPAEFLRTYNGSPSWRRGR